MGVFNFALLTIVLSLDDFYIAVKLFLEATKSRVLQFDKLINMNEMISQSHLVLLFSLIEITIKHLKNGIFCINLSVMILLVNTDFLF